MIKNLLKKYATSNTKESKCINIYNKFGLNAIKGKKTNVWWPLGIRDIVQQQRSFITSVQECT
jgi:hypothetical protein